MSVETRSGGTSIGTGRPHEMGSALVTPSIGRSPSFSAERGGNTMHGVSISRTGAISERGLNISTREGVTSPENKSLFKATRPLSSTRNISKDTQKFVSPFKNTEILYQKPQQKSVEKSRKFPSSLPEYKAHSLPLKMPERVATKYNVASLGRQEEPRVNSNIQSRPLEVKKTEVAKPNTKQPAWSEIQSGYAIKKSGETQKTKVQPDQLETIASERKANPFTEMQRKAVAKKANGQPKKGEGVLSQPFQAPRTSLELSTMARSATHEVAKANLESRVNQLQQEYTKRYGTSVGLLPQSERTQVTSLKREEAQKVLEQGAAVLQQTEEKQDLVQSPDSQLTAVNQEKVIQLIHNTVQEKGLAVDVKKNQSITAANQPTIDTKVGTVSSSSEVLPKAGESRSLSKTETNSRQARTIITEVSNKLQTEASLKQLVQSQTQNKSVASQKVTYRPDHEDFVVENEEIVAERDPVADQNRIDTAVAAGEIALDEAHRDGREGITSQEIATKIPAKPDSSLVSTIRKQLDLPLDTEEQYDHYRAALAGSSSLLTSINEIQTVAKYATDQAPAVRLNTRITTEAVKPIDELRAAENGEEQLIYFRQQEIQPQSA